MKLAPELFLLFFSIVGGSPKEKHSTSKQLPKCVGLMDGCGYTMPDGDITVRYGDSLNITCYIYDEYVEKYTNASSRLYFTRNKTIYDPHNGTVSNSYWPKMIYDRSTITPFDEVDVNDETAPRIQILDERSIRLIIPKPEKTIRDFYGCFFNETTRDSTIQKAACTNVVGVGVPPQLITDFACVSVNYEKLVCSWTAPQNYLMTQYRLDFKSTRPRLKMKGDKNRTNGTRPYKYMIKKTSQAHCPTYPISDVSTDTTGGNLSCVWSVTTSPQYRQSKQLFKFILRANNTLGEIVQYFDVDHFKNMRPKPVEQLTATAKSPSSIILTWEYNAKLDGFPKPLEGEIRYTCDTHCDKIWSLGGRFNTSNTPNYKVTKYELRNLEFPHTVYDIRVRKKVNIDDQKESRHVIDESNALVADIFGIGFTKDFTNSIIAKFKNDEIGNTCNNDILILKYGAMQYEKYGDT
ncbi:uncharacterized protein LOC114342541 [Diabrotica virgifera virgifera]|uniref:Cytokine receptor-like n=2 Tax=Diabrotica virgifera virgifera TaxID=50390 RepID=A0ABM5L972_DIAVI|nr:uncharacterized protein LOC114342541 [Diabrotica virgifera virgifera]